MKAGFFEVDITPAIGMEVPGSYQKRFVRTVSDPLKVRAGVFDDGASRVALVGVDTCVLHERTVAKARAAIAEQSDIDPKNVLIAASHTHSGGPLGLIHPEDFADAPKSIRDLATVESACLDPLYEAWAVSAIASAVIRADLGKKDVSLSFGKGNEDQAAFNRVFHTRSGKMMTHPGKGNPDIIGPAGPIDPDVGVVAAWDENGRLVGCAVNYACHGTCGRVGVSADWIYYLEKTIRGVMGDQAVVVFLNGACGDVTQVNNRSTRESESGDKWSRHVGVRVGAEALKVLVTAEKGPGGAVAALSETSPLKRRRPSAESVKRAQEIVAAELGEKTKSAAFAFAKERLLLDYLVSQSPEAPVETQAIQIGPAVFLANPTEYFCQWGPDIKARSKFPFTFVVELANGGRGYVPTEKAFGEHGGGYESRMTAWTNLEPGAGRKIMESCLALADRLTPGETPQGAQAPTPAKPWAYGCVGPELE